MIVENAEFASGAIKKALDGLLPCAKAYGFFRVYDEASANANTVLRDRTAEVRQMVRGLAGDLAAATVEQVFSGSDLIELGDIRIVGAACRHNFKIIAA